MSERCQCLWIWFHFVAGWDRVYWSSLGDMEGFCRDENRNVLTYRQQALGNGVTEVISNPVAFRSQDHFVG